MDINIHPGEQESVVELDGSLTGALPPEQLKNLLALVQPGKHVILDFSQTTTLSGLALRKLLLFTRFVHAKGGTISARGAKQELHDFAEAAGFIELTFSNPPRTKTPRALSSSVAIDTYPTHSYRGYSLRQGSPLPFGVTVSSRGINFSVYSRHAESCTLVLFSPDSKNPVAEIPFPAEFKIGDVFAMLVFDLDLDQLEYGYRMSGPNLPEQGHRFDSSTVLLDPMARSARGREVWGIQRGGDCPYRARAVPNDFDWEGERPLQIPIEDLVVYEMHVRGFTRSPTSGVRHAGTFAGLRDKIPYLKELGVNCIELMPVFEFDEQENKRTNPLTGERLFNYWGYSTVAFCAPKAGYAITGHAGLEADEFKTLIKHLHRNGIEVILDVVFNHSAEGDATGPTISFRGLDNRTWYMLGEDGEYLNFSGCGNTLNCNHPVVRDFVLQCLRAWVSEFHIDGFRFDLASILGRDAEGVPLRNPPLLEALAMDPILSKTKLIAEAWDAGGLYQVGTFPSYGRWAEWNGKYRDCVRKFLKSDVGQITEFAQRLLGSPDLYPSRGPTASVNFITCHDGFTLLDLVSYNEKHNEANGEDNRDGANDNESWNCGSEGPTDNPAINALRQRQIRNALTILFLSQGVPMLLMGDEFGRTQLGNNNTYCHDGPINWLDWGLRETNSELFRFCRNLVAFRRAHPALRYPFHAGATDSEGDSLEVSWHGTEAWKPDWSAQSRTIAVLLRYFRQHVLADVIYAAFNMYWEPLEFKPPEAAPDLPWRAAINTAMPAPSDIAEAGHELFIDHDSLLLEGRSVVVLVAKPGIDRHGPR